MMRDGAYYNDNDAHAAAWLSALAAAGEITPGRVDSRSIADVRPDDVAGFRRVHWFAGIGGWEVALRLAGWPSDRPVWTASLPCQPFSSAGLGLGDADHRHLWPVFLPLVAECRPATIFGEQVSNKKGREWLARVRLDLEELGYAVGCADLCAAGTGEDAEGWIARGDTLSWEPLVLGAPHIRQRLFWVASRDFGLGDAVDQGWEGRGTGLRGGPGHRRCGVEVAEAGHDCDWSDFDVIPCSDGKSRRAQSGVHPLAHGISGRVAQLRGYGNAIVPAVAADFIKSFLECEHDA